MRETRVADLKSRLPEAEAMISLMRAINHNQWQVRQGKASNKDRSKGNANK